MDMPSSLQELHTHAVYTDCKARFRNVETVWLNKVPQIYPPESQKSFLSGSVGHFFCITVH